MNWYELVEYLANYYDIVRVSLLFPFNEGLRKVSQHLACIINFKTSLHDISWHRLERLSGYLPLVSKLR